LSQVANHSDNPAELPDRVTSPRGTLPSLNRARAMAHAKATARLDPTRWLLQKPIFHGRVQLA
jgi:hypothetical protein